MTPLRNTLRSLFTPAKARPLPAGVYHYQSPPDDPRNYRLHLRLEPDGNGVMIVNASTVLHLNHTAAEYAYYLVHNLSLEQASRKMAARYQVSIEVARNDYAKLAERIQSLINTPDLDPVTFLDFERQAPFSGHISAPYRLDCALTYRLPTSVAPEVAPSERVKRELTTAEWARIIDKAWQAGIPHLVFTGGEPTLRDDLSELIAHAEANSQVTGLLTDGLRLVQGNYLDQLLATGLDHLLLLLQPADETAWEALRRVIAADIFAAVHLTINSANSIEIGPALQRLADLGVPAVSLSAADPTLTEVLQTARNQVADLHMDLVWNLPVPYSALHPIAIETETFESRPGAGRAWLYVEPDGDVLPAQGINQIMGNLLNDPWEAIWRPT